MLRLPAVLSPLIILTLLFAAPAPAGHPEDPPDDRRPAKKLPLPGEVFSVEGYT